MKTETCDEKRMTVMMMMTLQTKTQGAKGDNEDDYNFNDKDDNDNYDEDADDDDDGADKDTRWRGYTATPVSLRDQTSSFAPGPSPLPSNLLNPCICIFTCICI